MIEDAVGAGGAFPPMDIADRELYGFSTAADVVEAALAHGPNEWGTPLTETERGLMKQRARLVGLVSGPIESLVAEAPAWFGGAVMEHVGAGRLVVMATQHDPASDWASSLGLDDAYDVEVRDADFSRQELDVAFRAASEARRIERVNGGHVAIHGAAIDPLRNRVIAFTDDAVEATLATPSDNRILIEHEPRGTDQACATRNDCDDPRGGAYLRSNSGSTCTLGFTIIKSGTSDLEFWTTGHCAALSTSTVWDTFDGSFLGVETHTSSYFNGTKDVMRVELSDADMFLRVYPEHETVAGWEWPVVNSAICASRGKSAGVDCGTVKYSAVSWYSDSVTPNRLMYGARHQGITSQGGDSGAPIYRDAGSTLTAVGLHAQGAGNFTRVSDIAGTWIPG